MSILHVDQNGNKLYTVCVNYLENKRLQALVFLSLTTENELLLKQQRFKAVIFPSFTRETYINAQPVLNAAEPPPNH